jgi:hypothetical protein
MALLGFGSQSGCKDKQNKSSSMRMSLLFFIASWSKIVVFLAFYGTKNENGSGIETVNPV